MLGVLISVIVVCVIIGLLLWAIANLPFIPAPMGQILRVVIIVVGCLWLIGALLGYGGFGGWGHGIGVHIN
jgi:hypothetical protein